MPNPTIQQVEAQIIAAVRCRATIPELSKVITAACGEVWNYVKAAQVPNPGRHVALYVDHDSNGAFNLEVGVEVPQSFVGNDRVVCSNTPAGTVATVAHIGPYNLLKQAHDAIHKWCKEQGHSLAGPSWEVYGHMTDPAAPPRTDIFYLLR